MPDDSDKVIEFLAEDDGKTETVCEIEVTPMTPKRQKLLNELVEHLKEKKQISRTVSERLDGLREAYRIYRQSAGKEAAPYSVFKMKCVQRIKQEIIKR